jgi:hypothetical protein
MAPTLRISFLAAMLAPVSAIKTRLVETDACACQVWKDVYAQYGRNFPTFAFVGEGMRRFEVPTMLSHLSSNVCVNDAVGEHPTQYCLVSAGCQQLNGGAAVTEQISKKMCTEADERLVDKTMDEIGAISQKDDVNLETLLMHSYVTHPSLRSVEASIMGGEARAIQYSGIPTYIRPPDGDATPAVIADQKVYKLFPMFMKQMKDFVAYSASGGKKDDIYEHAGSWWIFACFASCE